MQQDEASLAGSAGGSGGFHQGLDDALRSQRRYRFAGHVHGEPMVVRAQGVGWK